MTDMENKNLLLLSNSTLPGQPYFSWPMPYVGNFVENHGIRTLAFVPYAAATFSFEKYTQMLQKALDPLNIEVINVDTQPSAVKAADAIAVGGGNTFALLKRCYEHGLVSSIQEQVAQGKPYMGWSAGANLSCPTLCTTNDMPIVEPPSFNALNLIPFQINPHYTDQTIPNHGGESRDTRLTEYLALNSDMCVAGIPEGSLLEMDSGQLSFKGEGLLKVFKSGQEPTLYKTGDDISFLLK